MLSHLKTKLNLIWIWTTLLLWVIFSQSLFLGQFLPGSTLSQKQMYQQVVDYIIQNTNEKDTIYVNLYAPWIYGLSGRKSAANIFLGGYVQVENANRFGYGFESQVITELGQKPPKYIIQPTAEAESKSTPDLNNFIKQNTVLKAQVEKLEIRQNINYVI